MSKTIALLRCSTTEQDTEHQRNALEAWAKARGEEIDEVRDEESVSGASNRRPILDEIVRDAARGRVKVLVVFELERLGRTMPRIVSTIHQLNESGCAVVDVRRGIDSRTEMGRAMLYMAGIFAEIERNSIRERTRSGLAAARRRGVVLGRRPDRWDRETVEQVRTMLAEGMTPYGIFKSGALTVWRPVVDKRSGKWTEKPVRPGETAVYRKCAEVGK